MSGDGRTALGWPPKPPCLAVHRLVRPEVKSKFDFDINTKRWFGPIGSSWRSIRAYCGCGIVEHMSGDGQTALGWPPKSLRGPPWPVVIDSNAYIRRPGGIGHTVTKVTCAYLTIVLGCYALYNRFTCIPCGDDTRQHCLRSDMGVVSTSRMSHLGELLLSYKKCVSVGSGHKITILVRSHMHSVVLYKFMHHTCITTLPTT